MSSSAAIVGEARPVGVGDIDLVPPNMLPRYLARFLADRGRRKRDGGRLPLQAIHSNYLLQYGRALRPTTALVAWTLHAHARWHAEGGGELPPADIGSCWPAVPTLASIVNTSETNVKQFLLPELEETGFVRVVRRNGVANRYHLLFAAEEPVARSRRSSARQAPLTGDPSTPLDADPSIRVDANNEENHEENLEPRTGLSETRGGGHWGVDKEHGLQEVVAIRLLDGDHRGDVRHVSPESAVTLIRRGRAVLVTDDARASA